MMQEAMSDDGLVHTPYGATECLPVASISSAEMTAELVAATRAGRGTCVGRPVAPNEVKILRLSDDVVEVLRAEDLLPAGEVGEIIVQGPTATDSYWRRETQTRLAKMTDDQERCWHRMGDAGYFDEEGRLWFCGRKSQRIQTARGDLFADQVESIFNGIEGVERTALVGLGQPGNQEPLLCVEMRQPGSNSALEASVKQAIIELAGQRESLRTLTKVLIHPGFPVDRRHNAKIGREALQRWAEAQVNKQRQTPRPEPS
jgi:acyl-CoA synthetase (AMP-forming)/AMP-acid ligase II